MKLAELALHDVGVFNDHVLDTDALAGRLRDVEALVQHPRAHGNYLP